MRPGAIHRRITPRAGSLALAALAVWAPVAAATFHEMSIREIYPGSVAQPESEYVELQMWAPGQNLVGGHTLRTYSAGGAVTSANTFAGDVSGDASQSTILLATPAAESEFGVASDTALVPGKLDPAGGAVCWEVLDCVSWGTFGASLPSPAGSPATPTGTPGGMALRRTIAPGCATLLEPTDDRDNSAADFSAVFPDPRPNSIAPAEHACTSYPLSSPGGSGGGRGDNNADGGRGAPETKIKRKPPHGTRDRTPTFRFTADEPESTFQCKLDRGPFGACRSPFTTRRLALGPHTLRVRARDGLGNIDPTPALYAFKVIARR